MNSATDKFVIAKRNTMVSDEVLVQKNDVGIIKSESKEVSHIFL